MEKRSCRFYSKRGQVWVETVIYTLIGLAIMGLVLASAQPKIECKKDFILIEQAVQSMGSINEKIYEVQRAAGNRRAIDLKIGKGTLTFDLDNEQIRWLIESECKEPYSEPGVPVQLGTVTLLTTGGAPYGVELSMNYSSNLEYGARTEGVVDLMQAPNPYKITIENDGQRPGDDRLAIVIREDS